MLDRARHWSDRAIELAAMLVMSMLLLCVLLGVATRALNNPLIWTDEVSRFLMIWLAALGWLLASRKRIHIRIRFFVGLLPASLRRRVELVTQVAVALFGVLTVWYSVDLVTRNFDVEATTVPIAMSYMYLPIVLAGLMTAAQAVGEIYETLQYPAPPVGAEPDGSND
jgi:TRAP-type C4-dicarboxylate transport system permease small subunit